jgi:hypothetical protein
MKGDLESLLQDELLQLFRHAFLPPPPFFALLAFAISSSQAAPVISEFMADNEATLADEDGIFNDWIEISNPDERAILLLAIISPMMPRIRPSGPSRHSY